MKILYILHSTIMGGATISFIRMLKGLTNYGVQPIIVVPSNKKMNIDFINEVERNKWRIQQVYLCQSVFQLPNNYKYYPLFIVKFLTLPIRKIISWCSLYKTVKDVDPDLIHTNTGIIHEGYSIANYLHIPHVWHLREYQTLDFRLSIYPSFASFRQKLKKSFIITITKDICNYFNLTGCHNVSVIYNGIFSKDAAILGVPKEDYFLCASRISPEKGIEDVIKAFAKFVSVYPNYKLLLAGRCEDIYKTQLQKLSELEGCNDNIVFMGYISDVRKVMSHAKSLIVGSYNEGFGRMTAEAFFCGTMVIGRDTAGTKEILDMTGGLRFTEIQELTQRMFDCVQMPTVEYDSVIQTAQQIAIEKFSEEQNVKQVCDFYKMILDRKKGVKYE